MMATDTKTTNHDVSQDAPLSPSFPRGKNILAVASGKGGVGKTFFSITLAQALTRMGKKVCLFDGDLGLANVDVQLGLMPKRDLNDVIRGRLSLDKVVILHGSTVETAGSPRGRSARTS